MFDVKQASILGNVNGINLERFLNEAAFLDSNGTLTVNGSLHIFNNVSAGSIETNTVNGMNLETDILLNHQNQTISGNATFMNISTSKLIVESLNGINFTDVVQRSMRIIGDQNITGKHVYTNNISTNGNVVTNLFNGVDVDLFKESAISKTLDDAIEGHLTFTDITTVEQLVTDSLLDLTNVSQIGFYIEKILET